MKRAFTILLLSIHLFNTCGYRLFFSLAEKIANKQMVASLDENDYSKSELIQIKLVLNMPYLSNNKSYERCDGQVEVNGIQYNYVKRMVTNDTLYLYCIPNNKKTQLNNSKNLYAKQNADTPPGKSEQPAVKKINFFNEYSSGILNFTFDTYHTSSSQPIAFSDCITLKGFTTNHLQPPDLFI